MIVTVKGIDLDVDADVFTDETWPDRRISCGVEVIEVRLCDVDILPLLSAAVVESIEAAVMASAIAKHRETIR